MSHRGKTESDIFQVLLETYAANGRMNQLILDHVDARGWRTHPPGANGEEARTIAAIFAHVHNSRLAWAEAFGATPSVLRLTRPLRCTIKQTATAHQRSSAGCLRMLRDALSDEPNRRVTKFSRGSWAPAGPAGASMFAYMLAHDAHHRGQVITIAHQLGYRLPDSVTYGIWHWDKLWTNLGFVRGPR